MSNLAPTVENVRNALKAQGVSDAEMPGELEFNFKQLRTQGKLSSHSKGPSGKAFMEQWMPYTGAKPDQPKEVDWLGDIGQKIRDTTKGPLQTAGHLAHKAVDDFVIPTAVHLGGVALGGGVGLLGGPAAPVTVPAGMMAGGLAADTALRSAKAGKLVAPEAIDYALMPLDALGGAGLLKATGRHAAVDVLEANKARIAQATSGLPRKLGNTIGSAVKAGQSDVSKMGNLLGRAPKAAKALSHEETLARAGHSPEQIEAIKQKYGAIHLPGKVAQEAKPTPEAILTNQGYSPEQIEAIKARMGGIPQGAGPKTPGELARGLKKSGHTPAQIQEAIHKYFPQPKSSVVPLEAKPGLTLEEERSLASLPPEHRANVTAQLARMPINERAAVLERLRGGYAAPTESIPVSPTQINYGGL